MWAKNEHPQIQPMHVQANLAQRRHIDFHGPIKHKPETDAEYVKDNKKKAQYGKEDKEGYYIIGAIDAFSKYLIVSTTPDKSAEEAAKLV